KSQTKEPAISVCIDDATIFGHFNLIGQNFIKLQTYSRSFLKDCIDHFAHVLTIANSVISHFSAN
ncbi:hypothetical protein T12_4924, partial [Trichinella patagoniensis]